MIEIFTKTMSQSHPIIICALLLFGCSSGSPETTTDINQSRSRQDNAQSGNRTASTTQDTETSPATEDSEITPATEDSEISNPMDNDTSQRMMNPSCTPVSTGIILPLWTAGQSGTHGETGSFGKPDAIFIDPRGYLLAGDEDDDFEEIHVFDLQSDDPLTHGDALEPLIDLGAAEGGGDGEMEFRGISGFAQDRISGDIYVLEQGNGRIQILSPLEDADQAPYFSFKGYFGAFAPDKDHPQDGEFVRLQAARTDSLQRLFVSDDAKKNAISARRDIQVFDSDLELLFKFGDASYGPLGAEGNLKEPENFVIDEARNRIYVCDEGPGNVVIYRYDDLSFITRLEGFSGAPNGIDIDQYGYIYVVHEGWNDQSDVRVFNPDTLTEVMRFGEGSESDDLTLGTFNSPDTLVIDIARDLLVLADQGHDRIQGFQLSEIQARACIRKLRVSLPPTALVGTRTTLRVDVLGADGSPDRRTFEARGAVNVRAMGTEDILSDMALEIINGTGSATVDVPDIAGQYQVVVSVGGLESTLNIDVLETSTLWPLEGELGDDELSWSADRGIVHIVDDTVVPADKTLLISPGTLVLMGKNVTLTVQGQISATGSSEQPISFTSADANTPWTMIEHHGEAHTSLYAHTFFVGGGGGEQIGHCCGPVMHHQSGTLILNDTLFADGAGKALWSEGVIEIRGSAFHRMGMGPELAGPDIQISDSHFVGFSADDDDDALYIRGSGPTTISDCVIAYAGDDGIDMLVANVTISDTLIHHITDKAISVLGGALELSDSLIIDSAIGFAVKDNTYNGPVEPLLIRSTFAGHTEAAIKVFNKKDSSGSAVIRPEIRDSIIWDVKEALVTDYEPQDITVKGSTLTTELPITGEGNVSDRPAFIAPERGDYRLNPMAFGSSLGDGESVMGWSGFE